MAISRIFFGFLIWCPLMISINCAEQHEADADKCKSKDEVCEAKNPDKLHNYQVDAALQSQQMLHTMTTVEMYRAQREVAHYLEMAYLQLEDHLEVAKEVRLTAHESRSQHLMTSGLMKKFKVTAVDIVRRKIPDILFAIEIKYPAIIKDILSDMIKDADQMKDETEKTQKRYNEIHVQLRKSIETLKKKTALQRHKSAKLSDTMEAEKQRAKLDKENNEMLEMEKAILETGIKNRIQKRDELFKSLNDARKEQADHEDNTFTFGPDSGGFGFVMNMLGLGNVLKNIFGDNRKAKFYQELAKEYRAADESVHRAMEGKMALLDKINAQRKEALARLEKIKRMVREQVDVLDINGLQEADLYLGNVDKQFARISMYWENMAATIKYLRNGVVSSRKFVHLISNPAVEKKFREDLSLTEKDWMFFGKICGDYIEENDKDVFKLYGFLSEPRDAKSAEARRKRQDKLIAQIEDDINSALPSMDDLD